MRFNSAIFLVVAIFGLASAATQQPSVKVWTAQSASSSEAVLILTSSDSNARTMFVQLPTGTDTWLTNTPLQFRSSALRLVGAVGRQIAPYGVQALLDDPSFLQAKSTVSFVNGTIAKIAFPQVTIFDGDGSTGSETVTLEIGSILLASGGAKLSTALGLPMQAGGTAIGLGESIRIPVQFQSSVTRGVAEGDTAWTVWLIILILLTAMFDPMCTGDLQMIILLGLNHCARGESAKMVGDCVRGIAPLTWKNTSGPTVVFLSSLLLPILIPMAYYAYHTLLKKAQPFWAYYGMMNLFWAAICWSTLRQLALPEGRVECYFFGVLGIPIIVVTLAAEVGWRWQFSAAKVRLRPFAWDYEWTIRLGVLPSGYWDPQPMYFQNRTLLMTLHPEGLSLMVYPHLVVLVGAAALGAAPMGPASCGAMFSLVATWYWANTIFVLVHRVFLTNVYTAATSLSYAFVGLAALGCTLQASSVNAEGHNCYIAGAAGVTIVIALRLVYRFYLWWNEDSWRMMALTSRSATNS